MSLIFGFLGLNLGIILKGAGFDGGQYSLFLSSPEFSERLVSLATRMNRLAGDILRIGLFFVDEWITFYGLLNLFGLGSLSNDGLCFIAVDDFSSYGPLNTVGDLSLDVKVGLS